MSAGHSIPPWSQALRNAREGVGLSREAIGKRAAIAASTIRSYETGARHPTREHLIVLLDALHLEPVQRTEILSAAGYAPEEAPLHAATPGYMFTLGEAQRFIEEQPWPIHLVNENMEIVAANQLAQRLWGVNLEQDFPSASDRNILVVASDPRFADRVANWEEGVSAGIALIKGHHRAPENALEGSQTYFGDVLKRFFQGDPKYIARFMGLWEQVPPRTPKVRWTYRIVWDAPGIGEICFRITVNTCNEVLALSFNDWIPEDPRSWRNWATLSAVLQDR